MMNTDDNAPAPHIPVMLAEVLEAVEPRDGGIYVDGTFGAGGYTRGLLERADCRVLGIDRDPDAIAQGKALIERFPGRLALIEGRFSQMVELVRGEGVEQVDGIVLDVGVSSMQIDRAERGFSFAAGGPLDMRMDKTQDPSAREVINTYAEDRLARIIWLYGEERKSRRIAKAIVDTRRTSPIETTTALASIVAKAAGGGGGRDKIHPATRTFQAVRIYVNQELDELAEALGAAERLLAPGGRLAVVSFHSLEDRIVKAFLRTRTGQSARPSRHMPQAADTGPAPSFTATVRGALKPSDAETAANPRARSARLRAAERTSAAPMPFDPSALPMPSMT